MPTPPPLPEPDRRPSGGPPPLPSQGQASRPSPPPASEPDPKDWLAALRGMGFRDEEGAPKLGGLNLIGEFGGRSVKAHISRRSKTRYAGSDISYRVYNGHRIEFNVETSVKTRCAMSELNSGLARWAAKSNRWFGADEIESPAPTLERYSIWANEESWASRFLASSAALPLLSILLPKENTPPNIGLKWWPGFLTYSVRIHIQQVDAARMVAWVRALLALAEAAEADPPSEVIELNRWEKFSLANPIASGCLIVGIAGGFFILLGLLFSGALVGIAYLLSS